MTLLPSLAQYERGEDNEMHWYMNFADAELFGYYKGPLTLNVFPIACFTELQGVFSPKTKCKWLSCPPWQVCEKLLSPSKAAILS